MKKILTLALILILGASVFAEKSSGKLFAKYCDKFYANYEFLINNPLFYTGYDYYPDLKSLEGKIVKTSSESYLIKNGIKVYGDSEDRDVAYNYYNFDKTGHISEEGILDLVDNNFVFFQKHYTYTFFDNKYIVKKTNLQNKNEETEEYSIKEKDNMLILERKNNNDEISITYEKGKITYQVIRHGKIYAKTEYKYHDDIMEITTYSKKDEIFSVRTLKAGVIIRETKPLANGEIVETLEVKYNVGTDVYSDTRDSKTNVYTNYLERRFNTIGFLEYELKRPMKDGDEGTYSISTATVLDESDELYNKYFSKEKVK